MPGRQIQHLYKYRTNDGAVHPFYAPNRDMADRYAARWARRMGYRRIFRLKEKRG